MKGSARLVAAWPVRRLLIAMGLLGRIAQRRAPEAVTARDPDKDRAAIRRALSGRLPARLLKDVGGGDE